MSPVEWSRISGDAVEAVLAVLLMSRNPAARELRPGHGDGGIDIYIPVEPRHWTVYQVKKHTGAMTRDLEKQIRASWLSTVRFADRTGITIESWNLLRPENSTEKDLDLYKELTIAGPFPVADGGGLTMCDLLAAEYPNVIDYYLRDGKEALDARAREYLRAAGFLDRADKGLGPAAIIDGLRDVHDALNADDPHYAYDFEVKQRPAWVAPEDTTWPEIPLAPDPRLIARTIVADASQAVIVDIYAKFAEAPRLRPLKFDVTVTPQPGSDEERRWADFVQFGSPAAAIPATISNVTMPGGLGSDVPAEGTISVWSPPAGDLLRLTIEALSSDGTVLADLDVSGGPIRRGLDGTGSSVELTDAAEIATIELRQSHSQTADVGRATINMRFGPTVGLPVDDALPVVSLLAALVMPNQMRIRVTGRNLVLGRQGDLPIGESEAARPIVNVLTDLATIQSQTMRTITVPDFSNISMGQVRAWAEVAQLLRGHTMTRGVLQKLLIDGPSPQVGAIVSPQLRESLIVEINGDRIDLGEYATVVPDMTVTAVAEQSDGRTEVTFAPPPGEQREAYAYWPADREPPTLPDIANSSNQ